MTKLRSNKLFAALGVMAVAMLALAAGVYAYDQAQEDRIAPGVTIGGIDVGDRTTDEARRIIRQKVVAPLTKPVTVTFEDRTFKLSSKQLDQRADVDGMLDAAVDASREGGLFTRISRYVSGSEVDRNLPPRITYSEEAVEEFVDHIAGKVDRPAVDATIVPSGDSLSPNPGEKGVSLKRDRMLELVEREIGSTATTRNVDAPVRTTEPEVTKAELAETYPHYVTVDRSSFTLRYFQNLDLVKKYTVSIGAAGYDTPSGLYAIQDKQVDPTWHVPESDWAGDLAGQVIPPGPQNPLKARWMGIYNGAGIHGTDVTSSLGTAASHGCVRMAIPDVIELYDMVPVGTPIYIS